MTPRRTVKPVRQIEIADPKKPTLIEALTACVARLECLAVTMPETIGGGAALKIGHLALRLADKPRAKK